MPAFTVLNPATEVPVAEVEPTSAEAADAAIARAGGRPGSLGGSGTRGAGGAAALVRRLGRCAPRGSRRPGGRFGSGHPAGQARWEAGNLRDVLRYYSAAPERLSGKQIPVPGGLNVTFCEPVGVVGVIVPWNFPMPILGWGVAPALAAGNLGARQAGRADPAEPRSGSPGSRSRRGCPTACSRCCRARGRWSASGWWTTRTCARSSSPGPQRWGGRSWPAAPGR